MKKILILLLLIGSTNVFAEWVLDLNKNRKILSDDQFDFKISDLSCGVTKTQFLRNPDDKILEHRDLYCKSPEGITFSVPLSCLSSSFEFRHLKVEKGLDRVYPVLWCKPSDKK